MVYSCLRNLETSSQRARSQTRFNCLWPSRSTVTSHRFQNQDAEAPLPAYACSAVLMSSSSAGSDRQQSLCHRLSTWRWLPMRSSCWPRSDRQKAPVQRHRYLNTSGLVSRTSASFTATLPHWKEEPWSLMQPRCRSILYRHRPRVSRPREQCRDHV